MWWADFPEQLRSPTWGLPRGTGMLVRTPPLSGPSLPADFYDNNKVPCISFSSCPEQARPVRSSHANKQQGS